MKRNIFVLLIAVLILTGCVVKNGWNNDVTPEKLGRYAESKLCASLVQPAFELASYLFIDEYQVADEETRIRLLMKYNAVGKIHQADADTFVGNYIGEVHTGGRPFDESGWASGWVKSLDGTWTNREGVSLEPLYDESGFLSEIAVSFDGIVEKHNEMQTRLSCQDGAFIISNPLCTDSVDMLFETSEFGASISDLGISFLGTVRIDIFTDSETIDWIILKGTGNSTLDKKTSRD